jgi:hypothetical protein
LFPLCFFFSFAFLSPWHWHLIWTFGSSVRLVLAQGFLVDFHQVPTAALVCSKLSSTQKAVAGRLSLTPLKGSVLLKCLCTYKCFCPHTEVLLCVVWDGQDTFNVIFHMINNRKYTVTCILSKLCVLWFLGVDYFNIIL